MSTDELQRGRGHWPITLALALACLGLTLWALPRSVQAGDAGEFSTIMLAGGVPHPPGYPWMRMLGPIARFLHGLGVPPASAAALPPALAGVAAWVVLHRVCVGWGQAWTGAFVLLLCAASPLVIVHANDSEVWGVHLLFIAIFLHASARAQAGVHPFRLGLLLGLAVSHHLTAVLLVPIAIAVAWPRGPHGSPLVISLLRQGGLGLLGSALGLVPLLTLAIGEGGAWRWGEVRELDGLLHHVLRRDYGTLQLSLHEGSVAASDTIGRTLASLGEVGAAGLIRSAAFGALLLVVALAVLARSASAARSSLALGWPLALGWGIALLLSTLGFPALHDIDPHNPFGAWILERFDLLPLALLGVPLSLALGHAGEWLRARLTERPRLLDVGAAAVALALLGGQLVAVLERGRPAEDRAVERAAIDLVESPDPEGPTLTGTDIHAIVLGTDDHRTFPVLYVQEVLGAGRHTLYIDASLLTRPWYREHLRRRFPELPEVDKPLRLIGALWSDPRFDAVPIYMANVWSAPAERLARVPEGMLWRVVPPSDHPRFDPSHWTPDAIADRHLAAFERYTISPSDFPPPSRLGAPTAHPWSSDLRFAYSDKARALASALVRAGRLDRLDAIEHALSTRTGETLP